MSDERSQEEPIEGSVKETGTARTELIRVAPKLAVIFLVILIILIFRADLSDLLGRTTKIGYGGFSVEAANVTLEKAGRVNPGGARVPPMSDAERERIIGRYTRLAGTIAPARILWVDDEPVNNSPIVDFLEVTIARVDVARSTDEARLRLQERSYEVVVSDFNRVNDPTQQNGDAGAPIAVGAGAALANIAAEFCGTRTILFSSVGSEGPAPAHVFAQTNRTYDLLSAIANVLESGRDPNCTPSGR